MAVPWIMITVLILLIIFGIIAAVVATSNKKKGIKRKTDYYTFFIIGITWLPFGILMTIMDPDTSIGNIFTILGLVYAIIGLSHKDQWKKNRKPYIIQNAKLRWAVVLGLLFLLALGIIFMYLKTN